jgi:hypothetical protein
MVTAVTTKILPKNREQEDAITNGQNFIRHGDPSQWFLIVGKAGTGKTTIVQEILRPFIETKNILICALSHKAKLVLADKLITTFGQNQIISKSIAGALGMKMDLETGEFTVSNEKEPPPIKRAHIIIVDEASMVNEQSHALIMQGKRKKAIVIYLGDIRQLPPIRESHDKHHDKPSPVFYSKNLAILTERIRQGEQSPILPYADYYGDNSRLTHPTPMPVQPEWRKTEITEHGELLFETDILDTIDKNMDQYQEAIKTGDTNIIKTVVYRNATRQMINATVRFNLFGPGSRTSQFLPNDMLMFQDNFSVDELDEPISNSFEIQINQVEPLNPPNVSNDKDFSIWDGPIIKYKCFRLHFIMDGLPIRILALDNSEVKRHAADVNKLFTYAKSLKWGTVERSEALARAWSLKKQFAPVDYGYAITSHKCQGSTYQTVIVDERDIMSVTMTSTKAKSQSMYTAITRASHRCIIVV